MLNDCVVDRVVCLAVPTALSVSAMGRRRVFATFLRGPAASISSKQQDYYIYADKVITVNIGALHLRCFEWFTKIHNNSNNNDSTNNNKPVVKIPQKSEYRNHCMN